MKREDQSELKIRFKRIKGKDQSKLKLNLTNNQI